MHHDVHHVVHHVIHRWYSLSSPPLAYMLRWRGLIVEDFVKTLRRRWEGFAEGNFKGFSVSYVYQN